MSSRIPESIRRITTAVALLGAITVAKAVLTAGDVAGQTVALADARRFDTRQLNEHFWSEGATVGDINRDGRVDIVSGPYWYEGPEFRTKHEFYPATAFFERKRDDGTVVTIPGYEGALGVANKYSDNFLAFTHDFNGDSWLDILVIGLPGEFAHWFENPRGAGSAWRKHVVFQPVDNESPAFVDVTGDGKPEIVCNSGGFFGYIEQTSPDPTQPWTFRPITPQGKWGRYTHGIGVGDVNGDRRADIVEAGGWWEQPASLDGQPVWTLHQGDFGAGAQFHVYDVNGDGRNDIIGSRNAHGYGLAWYEQTQAAGPSSFLRHDIMRDSAGPNPNGVAFSQIHAIELADINGDGLKDIVTGKRFWAHGRDGDPEPNAPAVVYWFELVRKGTSAEFVPQLVDDDSGVGTQVVVADVSGDGLPDVVVGNKKGTFVSIQRRQEAPRSAVVIPAAMDKPAPFRGLRPLDAADAMSLPPGFRAELFAGEPDVRQPVAFAIDDRGRVWVAEAYAYPERQPEGQGKDRILVLEDTDGDHHFDRRTIFANNLNLVSGIEVGFGGLWVGAAPYLMFIPIADGDEPKPAGPPRVLLDGWGYEDTHETLNSFIWGPDGWLYGAHGVFTHSVVGAPGTPASKRKRLNAGIWRYHPTQHRFEVFAEGLSNPWGLDFNDNGHAVAVACVIPHLWHVVQGGRYQRQAGQHFNPNLYDDLGTIGDHLHYVGNSPWAGNNQSNAVGGGHAHAGLMVYLGDSFPAEYRGQTFMNNIHGARINVDVLEANGSGYVGRHGSDFVDFNDPWSQVINLQYDQDGSVYLIDWYDQEQCHINDPEIPDRGNGRVFKIVYGNQSASRPNVQTLSDDDLIRSMLRRNEWHVRHARRVMQERAAARTLGADVVPKLRVMLGLESGTPAIAPAADLHDLATTAARLRLLWALHTASGLTDADSIALLAHHDEQVRSWAVQLATDTGRVSPAVARAFADVARTDESAVVRLYLASAAQRLAPAERWAVVEGLHAKASSDDHNLPMMLWYATEPLVTTDTRRALALATSSLAPRTLEFTARRVATTGNESGMNMLVTALRESQNDERTLALLTGMNAALIGQRDVRLPAGWDAAERALGASANGRIRTQSQALALSFGSPAAIAAARHTLSDAALPADTRARAMQALLNVRDDALAPLLLEALDDRRLRPAAIRALASYSDLATPARLIDLYPSLTAAEKRDALLTLASRPSFARPLVDALVGSRIPVRDVTADIARQILLLEQPAVTSAFESVWGVARGGRAETRAALARYTALIENTDLPRPRTSRGRQVFRDVCAACHTLFDDGGSIGPNITGSNRANLDYLLHNIVDPNAEIPNAYRTTTVELKDGRIVAGIANVQNASVVTVQTPNAVVTIPRSDIKSIAQADVSMMPEGLLQQLSDDDVRSLVAYLRGARQVSLPNPLSAAGQP